MCSNGNLIEELEISSTWNVEIPNNNLKNTLSLDYSDESIDLEDVVKLETCLRLVQSEETNNNEPCMVTITLPKSSPYLMSRVVVVSEARIIELFGPFEEYLTTETAEYIDDFEGCAVYMANCVLKPLTQVTIKFQRTKHANRLWLYGVKVKLLSKTTKPHSFSSINFQTVDEILRNAKVPISENAEKCKAFLQNHKEAYTLSQQQFGTEPPDPQLIKEMLKSDYCNTFSGKWKTDPKTMMNLLPCLMKQSLANRHVVGEPNSMGQTSEMSVLKSYIDNRFTQMENRVKSLEQKILEVDKHQQEKLDYIIDLIRNKANDY